MSEKHEEKAVKEEASLGEEQEASTGDDSANEENETVEDKEEATDSADATSDEQDWKDQYLRLFAEFDNFKKRTARERIELFKNASEEMVVALLPVLDDFDRGIAEMEENGSKAELEGLKLIHHKLFTILEGVGLQWMDSKGKKFDPEFHEAITEAPAPSKKLKGKVIDVVEKGYSLNDKIIRYAKVVVGK